MAPGDTRPGEREALDAVETSLFDPHRHYLWLWSRGRHGCDSVADEGIASAMASKPEFTLRSPKVTDVITPAYPAPETPDFIPVSVCLSCPAHRCVDVPLRWTLLSVASCTWILRSLRALLLLDAWNAWGCRGRCDVSTYLMVS